MRQIREGVNRSKDTRRTILIERYDVGVQILLGFVAACFILAFKHDLVLRVLDEGLTLYGSSRVANGEVPYRDFWTTYGPGSYYVGAVAFHLFGASAGVVRKIWIVFQSVVAIEVLILGRRLGGRAGGGLAFALALATTIHAHLHSGYTAVPATAAALGALIAYGSGRVFVVGILAGLTTIFRHDFGAYVAVTIIAGLWIRNLTNRQRVAPELLRFAGGFGVVALPIYGALAWAAGFRTLADQLLVFPATALAPYYALPLSWVDGRWALVPVIVVAVAAAGVSVRALHDRRYLADEKPLLVVLLCLLALGFLNYARIRLDRFHAWPMMIAAIPLIAAAPSAPSSLSRRRRVAVIVAGIFVVNTVLAILMLIAKARMPAVALAPPRGAGVAIPQAFASYNDLVLAIKARTRAGEPIFSGVTRHDRLFGADVLLYFLTDRPAATRYYELNRGLMASETVQAEIVRALDHYGVRIVVLLEWLSDEPNRSSISNGVTLLDDYIRAHYRRLGTFGDYELMERR